MRSGITPGEALIKEYDLLKFNKGTKCMILDIVKKDDVDTLESVFTGDKTFSYKDIFEHLPEDAPRFVLIDFDYETDENPPRKTGKIIFIFWCPTQKVKSSLRFIYSSSVGEIISTLGAVAKQFQVDDFAGLDYDSIRKELLK
jgi:hypothetical protein